MNDVEIKENCVVQFIDKNKIIETMQDCKYSNPCNDFQRGVNACVDIQIVGIKHMPAADVAPRSEVAREIFEEIENILDRHSISYLKVGHICGEHYYDGVMQFDIAELKKKYTEEDGKNG